MIGKTISHYKILEKIGEGGMGIVFKAEDTKLKRTVALKFLPPQALGGEEETKRFVQEAQVAAALDHPNICTVHEINESEGQTFIAMAYIEGQSLKERIESGPLKLEEALDIALQVAEGLQEAHEKGIVHRDIKSANIMVTEKGQVKMMDFGLAKLAGQTLLTKTGTTMGTIAYMSPEQALGELVDHQTDIWSFGVVLYEMLTGEMPFKVDYEQAVIYSILNQDPEPMTNLQSDVPTELLHVVQKTMQKDARQRYQQVKELLSELKSIKKKLEARNMEVAREKEKPLPSIAVLPFVNMSSDPENEYFSDGLAEELINALTKIKDFRVIARTSAFSFKGEKTDVREIGQKLNVETVLEGSVRKAGNRLRITAQLINVSDGYPLWSERYDRNLEDVFAIQDEIALAIVDKLKVELLGGEREELLKQPTDDQEAFTMYLKGRFHYNNFTPADVQIATQYFQQAIDRDANYAKAYAGLAEAYLVMGGNSPFVMLPPGEAYSRASAAVKEALALDDGLGEVHAALGGIRYWFEWDWEGAEHAFRRALALNPNDAFIHMRYGHFLWFNGQLDAAISVWEQTEMLDPLSPLIKSGIALCHYCARRYDEAFDQFQRVLGMDPNCAHAQLHIGDVYLVKSMYEEAHLAYQKAHALIGDQPLMIQRISSLYAEWGNRAEAVKYLKKLQALLKQSYIPPTFIALTYLALGEHDEMFTWLEKAYEEHDGIVAMLNTWPSYDPVRSDPRFIALLKKMGLEK